LQRGQLQPSSHFGLDRADSGDRFDARGIGSLEDRDSRKEAPSDRCAVAHDREDQRERGSRVALTLERSGAALEGDGHGG
jgi:hypothetical protein